MQIGKPQILQIIFAEVLQNEDPLPSTPIFKKAIF